MKLIKSKAELIQQEEGLDALYKHIETCGRVPYKSEDKSDGTVECAKAFVERMVKANHLAVLEHGTVYLKIKWWQIFKFFKYLLNPYSKISRFKYITSNLRVLQENNWMKDLQCMCESTKYHIKRYTFKVITSIGVTREFNRHRTLSILEQSTRYCNFSTAKFNNQVAFCKPSWIILNSGQYNVQFNEKLSEEELFIVGDGYLVEAREELPENKFLKECFSCEAAYIRAIKSGQQPQQARELLPLCTATEAVYTGFTQD